MKKCLFWLMAVLAAGAAPAQQGSEGNWQMRRARGGPASQLPLVYVLNVKDAAERAGITDKELRALRDLHYAQSAVQIDLAAGLEKAELELERLLAADKPDEPAVLQALADKSAAELKIAQALMKTRFRMVEIIGMEKFRRLQENQQMIMRQGTRRGGDDAPPTNPGAPGKASPPAEAAD